MKVLFFISYVCIFLRYSLETKFMIARFPDWDKWRVILSVIEFVKKSTI